MRVLIVGGAGFIGSHIAELLSKKGFDVSILVKKTTNLWRIRDLINSSSISIKYGDATNFDDVKRALNGIDVVVNSVTIYYSKKKLEAYKTNVLVAENIFKASLKNKVSKVIHISAAHISKRKLPKSWKIFITSEFGRGKYAAELLAKRYRKKGLNLIIARPSIVFGPKDLKGLTIALILSLSKIPYIWFGKPNAEFNPIFVRDLAEGILRITESTISDMDLTFSGKDIVTIKHLFMEASKYGGYPPLTIIENKAAIKGVLSALNRFLSTLPLKPVLPADQRIIEVFYHTTIFDFNESKEAISWEPKIGFKEGIKKTVKWIKESNLDNPLNALKLMFLSKI